MYKNFQKLTSVVLLICLSTMVFSVGTYAAAPTVKIVVSPNQTEVYAGSEPIVLTAQASGSNLKYRWTLIGPGKIDNTDLPAVFYMIPETISGKSAQAVITVTVTDDTGQEAAKRVILSIIPQPLSPTPTPHIIYRTKSEGMSTLTKTAIGVGAAAAIGGVAVLIANSGDGGGGGNDSSTPVATPTPNTSSTENTPFTGTFKLERKTTWRDAEDENVGYEGVSIRIFDLHQNGLSVTGTYSVTGTNDCCTASITVAVEGTVMGDGYSVFLNVPYEYDKCENGRCWSNASSWNMSGAYALIDDGMTLSYGTDKFTRQ